MLKTLDYSVTFPNGRTLANKINFSTGFGAIIGPNEAGKSFIIEVIRFALFGSAALRGKAPDYKTLAVDLAFTLKGVEYHVVRNPRKVALMRGDAELAVGTKPVNIKIVELFGYGLDVFDVAHVANQGDIEKLGTMRPAERKRMVDSVIGLGVIEDMATSCGAEATALVRRADDLKNWFTEPVAPVKPDDYEPADKLRVEVGQMLVAKSELDQLLGWLSVTRTVPEQPVAEITTPSEVLGEAMDHQRTKQAEVRRIEIELSNLPKPTGVSEEDLIVKEAQMLLYMEWQTANRDFQQALARYVKDKATLEVQLTNLQHKGHHECPACHHTWAVAEDQIASLTAEIEAMQRPVFDLPEPVNPNVTSSWINATRNANALQDKRPTLEDTLVSYRKQLEGMPNYTEYYQKRVAYEAAREEFIKRTDEFDEWQIQRSNKQGRADQLAPRVEGLAEKHQQLSRSDAYETALDMYQGQLQGYEAGQDQIKALVEEAEGWRKARAALTSLRAMVKQHLMPSLNKVASAFLVQMTGGARREIVVDEEFDIMVDGQRLDTLSGSGKAVVNLSLRLGLGQVLTNNVFSLFIADEIDASMDKDRAEQTADTLYRLKQRLSQILLVTHKLPTADYFIDLGRASSD